MGLNMMEYSKIRTLLESIYLPGLSDNVIASGFIIAFYVAGDVLSITVNPEVLFEKIISVKLREEIIEKFSNVAMTVGLRGVIIKDNKGRLIVRRRW